jgi:hypothetical protein
LLPTEFWLAYVILVASVLVFTVRTRLRNAFERRAIQPIQRIVAAERPAHAIIAPTNVHRRVGEAPIDVTRERIVELVVMVGCVDDPRDAGVCPACSGAPRAH